MEGQGRRVKLETTVGPRAMKAWLQASNCGAGEPGLELGLPRPTSGVPKLHDSQ